MKIAIVRLAMFLIAKDLAEKFRSKLLKVKKIFITDPNVTRYFMSSEEAGNLIISALEILFNSKNSNSCRTFVCDRLPN